MRRWALLLLPLLAGCTPDGVARPSAPPAAAPSHPAAIASTTPPPPPPALPRKPLSPADEARIDAVVRECIDRGEIPGAVVVVLRDGEVVLRKAYGLRAVQPAKSPMTAGTVFDLASLTKPLVTTTSILLLAERGKLRLTDPVHRHIPDFAQNGKDQVTIEALLLHTSGLPADNSLGDYEGGRAQSLARIHLQIDRILDVSRFDHITEPDAHRPALRSRGCRSAVLRRRRSWHARSCPRG
jgi:CubicO group peptidase (beta-lactamase class C family)